MKYTKSIILYGLIMPGIVIAVLIVSTVIGYNAFAAKAANKEKAWDEHHVREGKITALDALLAPSRPKMLFDKDLLARDIQADLGPFVDETLSGPVGSRLSKQSLDFPPTVTLDEKEGFSYRTVELGFIGRYDAMQTMSLDAETRFPQLRLASYYIQRQEANQAIPSPHLNFRVTFKSFTQEQ